MKVTSWLVALILVACGCGSPKKGETRAAREASAKVPEKYRVRLDTSKGPVVIEVVRAWAPRGADRFHELVRTGFYDGARFYRVRPKFIVQFGISADPKKNELWRQLKMPDDPVKQSNRRGFVSFAQQGAGSRTTQVFINLANNARLLDQKNFAPFGQVVEGLEVVDQLYGGYGEVQSLGGAGPDPIKLETLGDEYAQRSYPRLDQIRSARILD